MMEEKEKRSLPPLFWALVGAGATLLVVLIVLLLRPKAAVSPAPTEPPTLPTETAAPTPIPTPESAPTPTPHVHLWVEANCVRPAVCSICGETQGMALGHSWVPASYEQPRHCTVCGLTEGEVLPTPAPVRPANYDVDLYVKDESLGHHTAVAVAHSGDLAACEGCVKRLRDAGYNAYLYAVPEQDGYSIVIGVYSTREEAAALAGELHSREPVPGVSLEGAYAINVYLSSAAVNKYLSPWW